MTACRPTARRPWTEPGVRADSSIARVIRAVGRLRASWLRLWQDVVAVEVGCVQYLRRGDRRLDQDRVERVVDPMTGQGCRRRLGRLVRPAVAAHPALPDAVDVAVVEVE